MGCIKLKAKKGEFTKLRKCAAPSSVIPSECRMRFQQISINSFYLQSRLCEQHVRLSDGRFVLSHVCFGVITGLGCVYWQRFG